MCPQWHPTAVSPSIFLPFTGVCKFFTKEMLEILRSQVQNEMKNACACRV
jgi:hypothetical protein